MVWRLRLAVSLVAAVLTVPGCRWLQSPPNVVVISIDSLRADHLGTYGYPHPTSPTIDALAAEGVVFERAFSTTSWTLPAHIALFTGRDDLSHTVTHDSHPLPEKLRLLPEILRERGYFTIGYFSGPFLNPGFGFGRGFDEYHDCTSFGRAATKPAPRNRLRKGEAGASHRDVTNPILLEEIGRRLEQGIPEPYFLFVHFWDVHYDYIPPQRYRDVFDPGYDGTFTGQHFIKSKGGFHPKMDPRDFRHALALYDGEIRYTDDTLGTMLSDMRARGLLENTFVVITADHGQEFLEHGGKGHRRTLFEEVVRVPLILWYPGRLSPGRRDDLASIIDVAPTVLELVGATDERFGATGRSLLGGPEAHRSLLLELELPHTRARQVALRSSDAKVIHYHRSRLGPERREAYDLTRDPRELEPIGGAAQAPARIAGLFEELPAVANEAVARGKRVRGPAGAPTPAIAARTREQLKALGYTQ